MMLGECVEKGDKVIVQIPQENRAWGFNPCPNGTEAIIQSFGEIDYGYTNNYGHQPGIYENRSWTNVLLPNGEEIHISTCYLEPFDKETYQKKLDKYRQSFYNDSENWKSKYRLRDLPETRLYVGDYVSYFSRFPEYAEMRVVGIKYNYIGQKCSDGITDMPLYDISDKLSGGWYTAAGDKNLTFIRRGNVWKYYHQEPMEFASLEEEASLFKMLGRTRDVRNPANGIYKWTKDEVLDAIEKGIAHAFTMSNGFFDTSTSENAIRFLDEDLGKRVAEYTLKGFGRK